MDLTKKAQKDVLEGLSKSALKKIDDAINLGIAEGILMQNGRGKKMMGGFAIPIPLILKAIETVGLPILLSIGKGVLEKWIFPKAKKKQRELESKENRRKFLEAVKFGKNGIDKKKKLKEIIESVRGSGKKTKFIKIIKSGGALVQAGRKGGSGALVQAGGKCSNNCDKKCGSGALVQAGTKGRGKKKKTRK